MIRRIALRTWRLALKKRLISFEKRIKKRLIENRKAYLMHRMTILIERVRQFELKYKYFEQFRVWDKLVIFEADYAVIESQLAIFESLLSNLERDSNRRRQYDKTL